MDHQSEDHWGRTPYGLYLQVVIDLLSRFPKVTVVNGMSTNTNIHALDVIFSKHSPYKLFLTDSGPPGKTAPTAP